MMPTRAAHRLLTGLATITVVLLGGTAPATATTTALRIDHDSIEQVVADYLADSGAPGAAVAITRGDRILYTGGFGTDGEGEAITADTRLRIASLSKSFTALAIMQLVDQGLVDLDEPVVTYLPDFDLDDPRADDITVRQLLNHSSGMADAASPGEYGSGPTDLGEAVRRLEAASLVAEPGTEWNYHNPNYHLAARVVEVLSGEDFNAYLDDHVFTPAGMDSTTSTATTNQAVPGLADGHTFVYGQPVAVDGPDYFTAGAGGVVSTAEDLARWLVVQNNDGSSADGRRLVSRAALEEMHTAQEPQDGTYALGWYHTPAEGDRAEHISHSGGAAAFSGYQVLYPVPGPDYGIAVLLDSGASLTGPTPTDPARDIAALLGLDAPASPDPNRAFVVDGVATLLGLFVVAAGYRGISRSHAWASTRTGRPRWRTALRLVPYLLTIATVVSVPRLQLVLLQRDAPWTVLFYVAPVIVTVLALAAMFSAAILTTRLAHLLRSRWSAAGSRPSDHRSTVRGHP